VSRDCVTADTTTPSRFRAIDSRGCDETFAASRDSRSRLTPLLQSDCVATAKLGNADARPHRRNPSPLQERRKSRPRHPSCDESLLFSRN